MFDLEAEAWAYVRAFPFHQTQEQMQNFVNDWLHKDEQVEFGLSYFDRDVGLDLNGKTALEFGCGTGAMAFALERRGAEVCGVDIDEKVIDIAQRWGASRGAKSRFFRIDEHLPFSDASFDVIFSTSTFEHIDNPEEALRELARVLKPNGVLYLCFPNRLWPIEPHTGLWFLSWLPMPLARQYLVRYRPGWEKSTIRFYSYPEFLWVLKRSRAPLRVVCPPIKEPRGVKTMIKQAMHNVGVPYSAIGRGMVLWMTRQD